MKPFTFEEALKPVSNEPFSFEEALGGKKPPTFMEYLATIPLEDATKRVLAPILPEGTQIAETTKNPLASAVGRAAELAGAGLGAIAEVAERAADKLELAVPLSNIPEEQIKSQKQLQPLFNWAESLKGYNKKIGYEPSTKLGELTDNPINAIPFIVERVITSTPDMAAAVVNLPAYIGARTKEILDERVKNDNKTLDDATVADVTAAATAAIIEGTLERFATGRLLKGVPSAKTAKGRIGKELGIQSLTEGVEESAAYMGEAAGTVKGVDRQELIERAIEGAIVGGGLGGGVQTTREILTPREEAKPFSFEEALTETLKEKTTEAAPELLAPEEPEVAPLEAAPEAAPAETAAPEIVSPLESRIREAQEFPFAPGAEPAQAIEAVPAEVVEPTAEVPVAPLERPVEIPEAIETAPEIPETRPIPPKLEDLLPPTAEAIEADRQYQQLLEDYKRTEREKPAVALGTLLRNKLDPREVKDIGKDGTVYNWLVKKQGGKFLDEFVSSGQLNDFLPADLIPLSTDDSVTAGDKETAAIDYIKERLRNQDYLSEDTKDRLRQIDLSLDQLGNILSEERTLEEQRAEINDLLAEVNETLEREFPPAGTLEASPTGAERGAGEPTGPLRAEEPVDLQQKLQGSKVVDQQGKPLRMYHGTTKTFEDLKAKKGLIFFTPDPSFANKFAMDDMFWTPQKTIMPPEGGRVLPVYINAQNPFDYENKSHINKVAKLLDPRDRKRFRDGASEGRWQDIEDFIGSVEEAGFDAAYLQEQGRKNLAVFSSDQVIPAFNRFVAAEPSPEDKRRADMERDLFRLTPEEGGIAPTTGVQGDMFGATGLMAPTPQLQRRKNANTQQLSLFLNSDPDESQPGSGKARKAAVEAVEQLQESNNPMAMSLADEFAHQQVALLVGKKVKSIEDMAFLAQVYRDNRFETFRVFFTDAKGDIVSQLGITSRMPASTSVSIGDNVSEYFNSVLDVAKTKGATGYYLVHNHPSGRVQASAADRLVSATYAERFKQLEYKGHIIIDTNKYGVVNADGTYYEKEKDFGEKPFPGQEGEMGVIKSLEDVAAYTKQMELKENDIVLVATNVMGNVTQVSTMPSTIVTPGNKPRLRRALQKITLKGNASDLVVVGRNRDQLIPFVGLVKDVVFIDKNGVPNSMVYVGRKVLGGERPERVAAGTSPEFNYLKEAKNRKPASMKTTEAIEKDNPNVYPTRKNIFGQPVRSSWGRQDESKFDTWIFRLQDKMIDTKRVSEQIRKAGKEISDRWDAYLKEELYHGRTAKKTKDFLMNELDPLMQEMGKRNVGMAEFEEYLHNRAAKERNELVAKRDPERFPDGGSGILTADAQDYLDGLDPKKKADYEALAKMVDDITKRTRELLVKSGHETQETIDAWEKALPNYVPLNRAESDYELKNMGTGVGQGFAVRGQFSRAVVGSERPVVDILANLAMQRERAIVRTEKMRVGQALYGLVLQNPNPNFWLAVDPEAEANPEDVQKIAKSLADLGFAEDSDEAVSIKELMSAIMKQPTIRKVDASTNEVVRRTNAALVKSPYALPVRINGVDKYIFFNPQDPLAARMAQALQNVDADQMDKVLGSVAKVTRYFAAINTQYNPIFGVINFMRDVQGAMIQLGSTPLAGEQKEVAKNTLPALRGIYADLRARREGKIAKGEWAELWEQFQDLGGQTGFRDQFSRSAERADALYAVMNPSAWTETKLGKIFTANGTLKVPLEAARKSVAKPIFDWLSDYNETMENAIRLSAFKAALDKGLTPERAASLAKNLTVNFNRKGQIGKQAGALYAFFNASVQGTARMAGTIFQFKDGKRSFANIRLTKTGKTVVYGGLLLGSAQALLLAAAGFDEDEPPEFIKERNLIIPIGSGKYLTIPYPLGYNVIPNTSRIMTEWAMSGFKDTPKRVASITGAFLEMFNPIGNAGWSMQTFAPTILDIPVALAENKDWTGKPIAKKDISSLDPTPGYTRAKETATAVSTGIAEFLNWATGGTEFKPGLFSPTPDQIDYLIGQITGGVGREAMKVEQTARTTITGEELPPYKIPLAGRFYGETKSQAAQSQKFYDNIRMLNEHENEIKGRRKKGQDVQEYLADNPEARLFGAANGVETNIQNLRRRRKALLERNAPKEEIKAIEERITETMRRFNERVSQAKE